MEEVEVLTDPLEVKKLLANGKITDINAFMKQMAREHSDLVQDPEAFDRQWEANTGKQIIADFKAKAPESIGSKRSELQEALDSHGLAESFEELTDKQRSYGRITAKLSFACSVDDIEKVFRWAEVEFGALSWREKCLALFQAGELIGTTPTNYRGIRAIFLEIVKENVIEIKADYLEAKNKVEATQKVVCAKLLKAKDTNDIEMVFDWAEIELQRQLMVADKYIVFFQIAEMIPFDEKKYKAIRKIFMRMNKD
jgi:hypothetical protein